MRSLSIAPAEGFEAALRSADQRERRGEIPPEGYFPYVLALIGGVSAVLLWLKVSALVGLRPDSALTYRWGFLVAAALVGAIVGLASQALFGMIAARTPALSSGGVKPSDARLVWGASAGPQIFAVAVLLPLDLLIAGPVSFTSARPPDSLAAGWAALSVSLGLALAIWSAVIFLRGMAAIGRSGTLRSAAGLVLAVLCSAVIVAGFRFGAMALVGA